MMKRFGTGSSAAAFCMALFLLSFMPFSADTKPQPVGAQMFLTRHVRDDVTSGKASYAGALPATQIMKLNVVLPLRNEAALDELLERIYNPVSLSYHQYLSVSQFTEQFSPSQQDYDAALGYLKAKGLTIDNTAPNRLVIDVSGPVSAVEAAFHVTMGVYQHPTEKRTFFASSQEPSVNLPVALWHVAGLDNYSRPHPASLTKSANMRGLTTGSGLDGYFIGSDMRAAYYGGTTLTGAGQSVGLLEFAGYNVNDVDTYFKMVNQPLNVSVVGVSTDGSSLSCTGSCDDTEQVLDIEEAISMAPGLNQVLVYVSDTSDVSMFNRMATDNIAKALSCSWGWSPADPASDDPIFKEFAAQGQSLFVASGDSGGYRSRSPYVFPADDANVTSVGATDLTTVKAGGAWKSETAWSDSGGGISPNRIPIPSYQKTKGVISFMNRGSTIYRNSPDVAAEGNTDNYICYDGTCEGGWGGTSFAAPRWAGYIALHNQQAVAEGHGTAGFINPTIYTIGLGASYGVNFHDIISGNNGEYSAVKGYDLVTGWGSPNQSGLINALAR